MKKITGILLLLCCFTNVMAHQGAVIKSYAYGQQTVPGTQREDETEAGLVTTYFIYLEILKKMDVVIKYIWVEKQCSVPTTVAVTKLPVIVENNMGMALTKGSVKLVPKTSNAVLQVIPTDTIDDKKLITGKKLAAKNAFVIAYIYKGKWYYYTGKEIIQLEKQYGM